MTSSSSSPSRHNLLSAAILLVMGNTIHNHPAVMVTSLSPSLAFCSSRQQQHNIIIRNTNTRIFLTPVVDDFSDFDDDDDETTSSSSSIDQQAGGGSYGSNVVGGTSVGLSSMSTNPFQTDGGVIMPEGGANPCVIKVRTYVCAHTDPTVIFYS